MQWKSTIIEVLLLLLYLANLVPLFTDFVMAASVIPIRCELQ